MKFIVQNSPHGTIGNSNGRCMFACRTQRGSQKWHPYCFDVLRLSDGTCVSTSSFLHRTSFPERCDPQQNWFLVRDRTQWRNIKVISEGALGWNHQTAAGKIGLYGKHTLLVTPPHDGYWTTTSHNFRIPSLERDHAHPPGAPLCFRPLSSKKEVSLPHLVYMP
jgi:hypothetical protein